MVEASRPGSPALTWSPWVGYASGLLADLGHATVVVHFDAVAPANGAAEDVLRRVRNDTRGHRGGVGDLLAGSRRLPLVTDERLTDRGRERMPAGLAAGDTDGEVDNRRLRLLRCGVTESPAGPGEPGPFVIHGRGG